MSYLFPASFCLTFPIGWDVLSWTLTPLHFWVELLASSCSSRGSLQFQSCQIFRCWGFSWLVVLLYLLTYMPFPVLFIASCGQELLSGIISFKPGVFPLVYLVGQFCLQQISHYFYFVLGMSLFHIDFSRFVLLEIEFLADRFSSFSTLIMWSLCLLVPYCLMEVSHYSCCSSLYMTSWFSLPAFKIFFCLWLTSVWLWCV